MSSTSLNSDIIWTIINKYFETNKDFIVKHHLDSYNDFIQNGIPRIFKQNNPIKILKEQDDKTKDFRLQCHLYLGGINGDKIYYGKPVIYDDEDRQHFMFPNEARLRNMTYGFSIHYDIDVVFRIMKDDDSNTFDETTITLEKQYLGKFPIMLQSDLCILNNITNEARFNMGECRNDPGGYFIIDGKEKVIVSQEQFADNMLNIKDNVNELYSHAAEIRTASTDPSKPVRTLSVRIVSPKPTSKNGQIVVNVPNVRKPVPLFILMRALGVISDKEIIQTCLLDLEKYSDYVDLFIPSVYDAGQIFTQESALQYISTFTKNKTIPSTLHILMDFFLPNIGELNFKQKALFLGYMVKRLLAVYLKHDEPTDRDSFKYKRVELSGSLLYDLFLEYYKLQLKDIYVKIDSKYYYHKGTYQNDFTALITNNTHEYFNNKIVEEGVRKAFKGNWGAEAHTKRPGVLQDLNRLSFFSFLSHLRKLNLPLDASAKVVGPRLLHGTQWGVVCPVETPDGGNIGLHKHMAIMTNITSGCDGTPVIEWLRKQGMKIIEEMRYQDLASYTKIFVNGTWTGIFEEPEEIIRKFKLYRSNGLISIHTSIHWDIRQNEIQIFTDRGRLSRPIFYIDEDKKPSYNRLIERMNKTKGKTMRGGEKSGQYNKNKDNQDDISDDENDDEEIYNSVFNNNNKKNDKDDINEDMNDDYEYTFEDDKGLKYVMSGGAKEDEAREKAEKKTKKKLTIKSKTKKAESRETRQAKEDETKTERKDRKEKERREKDEEVEDKNKSSNEWGWNELIYGFSLKYRKNKRQLLSGENECSVVEPEEVFPALEDKPENYKLKFLEKYKSIITYLDTSEAEGSKIKLYTENQTNKLEEGESAEDNIIYKKQKKLENKYITHIEIHPSLILGIMGNMIVYPENNQLPRDLFSCGQSKQAVSLYHSNFFNRIDKMGVVLNYGQIPLIKSRYLDYVTKEQHPYGENAIVAIMCYNGYNVEDALIFNEGSIRRGLFRTTYFNMYEAHEETSNVGGAVTDSRFCNINNNNVIGKKPGYDYNYLDENGLIKENTQLNDKIVVIGKCTSSQVSPDIFNDDSVVPKKGQLGFVDKAFMTEGEEGKRLAKVRIREERIPSIGDKLCSRAGQKGTVGIILPEKDMPFTADGIRPDLIVNPHALPSRMTIGQLVESLMSKACVIQGGFGDCTAFVNNGPKHELFGKILGMNGFHPSGTEYLYNGMTGEQMESAIYIGPTYYLRLKHMVKDKINYRARGPRNQLTRQTIGGRAKDGGLRVGEMERDGVIAHGLSNFLKESMLVRGDDYYMAICNKTGTIAIYNEAKNIFLSPMADGPIQYVGNLEGEISIQNISKYGREFSVVRVPYAFKLLMQELQAMNIQLRIITEDNIDQLTNLAFSKNQFTLNTNSSNYEELRDKYKLAMTEAKEGDGKTIVSQFKRSPPEEQEILPIEPEPEVGAGTAAEVEYAPPTSPQYALPTSPQYAPPTSPQYAPPTSPEYAPPTSPEYAPVSPDYTPPASPEYVPRTPETIQTSSPTSQSNNESGEKKNEGQTGGNLQQFGGDTKIMVKLDDDNDDGNIDSKDENNNGNSNSTGDNNINVYELENNPLQDVTDSITQLGNIQLLNNYNTK
jgi:DNA-directed RNA polymerase beta subunit